MLEYLQCEMLRKKRIDFHNGVNAILGDDAAHNSIGKSSLLLMIDFVFGGNTYADSKDISDNLGDHRIEWCMEYDGMLYYFARSTGSKEVIMKCSANFEAFETITNKEYCLFLAEKQNCAFDYLTYRGIVGSFSRIWGRNNEDISHPLKQQNSSQKDDVIKIVQFFQKYGQIKQQKEKCDQHSEKKNALVAAAKHNLIPDIGARDYKDNLKTLADMEIEINELKSSITGHQQESVVLVTPEYSECKNARAQLVLLRSSLHERVKRTRLNQMANPVAKMQFDRLIDYFPQLNIEKLMEVDSFHQQLSKVLKSEITESINEWQRQIAEVDAEISHISQRMDELVQCDDSIKYLLERLTTLISSRQHIESCNEYYTKKRELLDLIKQDATKMEELWEIVLKEIELLINQKMQDIVDLFYETKRHAPIFSINQKTYKLIGREDTGTGTAYVNLIAFDMAICKLTRLPILIHDSMIFKNIETPALEKIFPQYAFLPQQIFIAIDEVGKFKEAVQNLLLATLVVQLTEKETLYIKDWKNANLH